MIPTFGGQPIFGTAVHVVHDPDETAIQEDAYPGINGVVSLFMGSRGRHFFVSGLLVDQDPFALQADMRTLESFADGIARDFVDTFGNLWQNVRFDGKVQWDRRGPKPCTLGWGISYSLVLRGLS